MRAPEGTGALGRLGLKRLAFFRVIIGFLSAFLIQWAAASTTIVGNVSVKGPDAPSGPIAGVFALVSRPNFPNQIVATAKTDANGNFTITGLMAGRYQVVFSKPGFADGVMSGFNFVDGETAVMQAQLVPTLTGTEVEASDEKFETKFTIHNPNSFSVHYAWQLPIKGLNGQATAPPGNSTLDTVIPPHIEHIALFVDGTEVQPINSTDVPPPTVQSNLTGIVDSVYNVPLGGVTVNLNNLLNNQVSASTVTLADGSYAFHNEPPGIYELTFTLAGYFPSIELLIVPATGVQAQTVYMTPLPTPPTATVDVTVKDSNGVVTPNVSVAIAYTNGNTVQGTTDGTGQVVFSKQPVNLSATITATTNDGSGRTASKSTSGFAHGSNAIVLVLPPIATGAVAGAVTNSSGNPLGGVSVAVQNAGGSVVASGTTASNGTYQISGLNAGTYSLTFSLTGYIAYSVGGVTITSGQTTNQPTVSLQSALAATVTVAVLDPDGYPVQSNVTINYSNGTAAGPTSTDVNGFVTFTSQPQNILATVSAAATDGTGRTGTATPQAFNTGNNSIIVMLPVDMQGMISGVVTDSTTGRPIYNALVTATDSLGNGITTATTDGHGQYTLQGLEIQPYTMTFTASGYQPFTSPAVVANSSTYNAALTPTTATVVVTVVDSGGNPFAGATVSIVYANSATPALGYTNATGTVMFTGQPVGTQATIAAMTSDGRSASTTQTFTEGSNNVALTLSNPVGAVSGVAVDATTSLPLAGVSIAVVDWNNNPVTTVTTGAQGTYSVTGLTPGTYTFTYSMTAYQTLTLTVPVTGGVTTTENASLTESPGGVQGTVTGSISRSPVPGCSIVLQGPTTASTTTDSNGAFSFSSLPPGAYTGTLTSGIFSQSISVTVVSNQVTPLNLILDTTSVAGKIVDDLGNPVQGAYIVLTGAGFVSQTVVTDGQGNFVANRESNTGNLVLSISYTDPHGTVWSTTYSFNIGSFDPPEWVVSPPIVLTIHATVTVSVVDSSTGIGAINAQVVIFYSDGSQSTAMTTDANGFVTFTGQPAGLSGTVQASNSTEIGTSSFPTLQTGTNPTVSVTIS